MFILRNAWRSISRAKGRNILAGIIALVIALSACLALSIRQAAETARESALEGLSITAQISIDRQKLMQNASGMEEGGRPDMSSMREALQGASGLSLEELETYAQAEAVKSFYYSMSTSMDTPDDSVLAAVDTSGSWQSGEENDTSGEGAADMPDGFAGMPGGQESGGGFGGMMPGRMGVQGDFTVTGYSSLGAMSEFIAGTSSITEGTVFDETSAARQCIVSDELATLNGLAVGDTITLANPNDEEETVDFTITGIYTNSTSGTAESGLMQGFSAAGDPANNIYTSYAALKEITDASAASAEVTTDEETGMETSTALSSQVSGTYTFATAEDYQAFDAQARALGLGDSYSITSTDLQSYENSLVPLENLSKFALYFLLVVLAIGGIILIVLNIFNIRERKYEIGVLTAIGMKKGKVALQFMSELFIVTFLAIIVGTAAGAAVSVPTTNALLQTQVSSQQSQQQSLAGNFGRPGDLDVGQGLEAAKGGGMFSGFFGSSNYIDQISSATNLTVVLQLMAIGVLLTLFSSSAAVGFIMRYEPLRILTSRD